MRDKEHKTVRVSKVRALSRAVTGVKEKKHGVEMSFKSCHKNKAGSPKGNRVRQIQIPEAKHASFGSDPIQNTSHISESAGH